MPNRSFVYAVSFTHSAVVSFHVKPDSQAIASKFALLCLAQFPANTLDAVMTKMKIVVDKAFMFSPFFPYTEEVYLDMDV